MPNPKISARLTVLLTAALLTLGACSSDGSTGAPTTTTSGPKSDGTLTTTPMGRADAAKADAAARAAFKALGDRAPALYVGVWDPDKGYFTKGYGNAAIGGANATVADSLRIGSITKSFTATVVLQLVADGSIDMAAKVGTYLPDLVAAHPELGPVTVRQLLSMHSGIPDYLNVPNGVAAEIATDPTRVWRADELVAAALKGDVKKPGTPGYSTTNYIILQMIAEKVSGKPLAELIRTRITDPLGIKETVLPPDEDTTLPQPVARGYLNQGCVDELTGDGAPDLAVDTDTTAWNASYGQGGGGMTSFVHDMGVWAASMSGNRLLPNRLAQQRLQTKDIGIGLDYGLGILNVGPWYGHAGEAIGWEAIELHNPENGVSYFAATNACNDTTTDFLRLLDKLYPNTVPGT